VGLDVSSLRPRSRARTVGRSPSASSCRISRWQGRSGCRGAFGGTAGSTKPPGRRRRPTARRSFLGPAGGDVGAGAGASRRDDVALWAVLALFIRFVGIDVVPLSTAES